MEYSQMMRFARLYRVPQGARLNNPQHKDLYRSIHFPESVQLPDAVFANAERAARAAGSLAADQGFSAGGNSAEFMPPIPRGPAIAYARVLGAAAHHNVILDVEVTGGGTLAHLDNILVNP